MNAEFRIKIPVGAEIKIGLLWFILLMSGRAFSQQIQLKGGVSIHNSRYETGEIQYVKDAFVSAPFTKPANTDINGNFMLEFVGISAGTSVKLQVKKQGLEVVNARDLEDVVISRKLPLRIFVAEKGKLAQAQADLYNISKKALFARKDALIAKLKIENNETRAVIAELEKKFHQKLANRFEAEVLLNEKIETLQKRLPEFAKELAAVNLDFASGLYIEAYKHFKNGEIEKVIALLDNETLDASYAQARERLAESKKLKAITWDLEEKSILQIDQVIKSYELKAKSLDLVFKYREVAALYEKIIVILKENTTDPVKLARWYDKSGLAHSRNGDYEKALEYHKKAMDIRQKVLDPGHPDLAASYHNVGITYNIFGDCEQALKYMKKGLAIWERILEVNHPHLATAYNNIGVAYSNSCHYRKALRYYQKALMIRKKNLGADHPDLATLYNNIGIVHKKTGNITRALKYQQKALAIRKKNLVANHPNLATSYNNIGIIYSDLGDYVRALAYMQKALSIREGALEPGHPHLAYVYEGIGTAHAGLGNYPKALEYHQKALSIREEALDSDHPLLAHSYNSLGNTYLGMGRYPLALEYYQKALTIREKVLDDEHSDLAETYLGFAKTYLAMNSPQKALEHQTKAIKILKTVLPERHSEIKLAKQLLKKIEKSIRK